jgi:PEGA domain-containing protein
MSARVVLAVAVTLVAGSAWADEKVPPATKVSGGGSHSSGSSSSSSSSSSSRSSDSGMSKVPRTDAQRRQPRPGTGTGHFDNDGRRGYDYRYSWGSPYYGGSRYGYYGYGYGYYNPYDSWYSPYYYSGYYGYSPSYYRRGYGSYRDSGSLRIIVDPNKTRVYVDGYYAGIVDDFDGILQRLNVPPGRHEITLKLEGYRTQHFKVYVPVDDTIKIHYDMVRGSGEATSEQFAGIPADYARIEDMDDNDRRRGDDDGGYDRSDAGDTVAVRLQVNPRDASVYVDGEFRGSGRQSTNLRLRPGRHRIEVVRPGFRTVEREVEVRSGRNEDLEFELEKL